MTGTAILTDKDDLDIPACHAPGSPLHGLKLIPRTVTYDVDPIVISLLDARSHVLFGEGGLFETLLQSRNPKYAVAVLLAHQLTVAWLHEFLADRLRDGHRFSLENSVEVVMQSVNAISYRVQQWGLQFEGIPESAKSQHEQLQGERRSAPPYDGPEDSARKWLDCTRFYVDWEDAHWLPPATFRAA
jgi:hypothetical protein